MEISTHWLGTEITDHVQFVLKFKIPDCKLRQLRSYDRKLITSELISLGNLPLLFYIDFLKRNLRSYEKSITLLKTDFDSANLPINPDMTQIIQVWPTEFKSFAKEVAELRFSGLQGQAFKLITAITKYDQYSKRDGSVISIIKQGNHVITDEHMVHHLIIQELQNKDLDLFARFGYTRPVRPSPLKRINWQETCQYINKLSSGKALASFPFPDELLKELVKNDIEIDFNPLWNPSFLINHPEIFQSKLIPLKRFIQRSLIPHK